MSLTYLLVDVTVALISMHIHNANTPTQSA